MAFNAEQAGAYMFLLCYQWMNGPIPDTDLATVGRCSSTALAVVKRKFIFDDQSKTWINKRLEEVRTAQLAFRQKQAENGRKGGLSHKQALSTAQAPLKQASSETQALHTPSPNNKEARSRFEPPSIESVKLQAAKIGLSEPQAESFFNYYESNGWRVGRNPMRSWTAAMAKWKLNQTSYASNSTTSPARTDRNIGTANDGKASQYRGVGKVGQVPNIQRTDA